MNDSIELAEEPRALNDKSGIFGEVVAELFGPDGELKARCATHNLVTSVGDQYYAGRAALSSSLPAQVTGMKLGSGSTAVAKSPRGSRRRRLPRTTGHRS